jgi:glycolate oxidase iron-sulfur subunit
VAAAVAALQQEEAGLLACVHCGFCLNACPTYTRLGHEGDSPRGRLDLMRAVLEGRLEPDDPAFQLHIDRCLGCRACEPVCPSGVPYGFLLERARGVTAAAAGVAPSTRLLIAAFTGPFRGAVGVMSRLVRGSGLPRLLLRLLPPGMAMPRLAMAMLASSAPWRGLRNPDDRGLAGSPGQRLSAPGRPPAAGAADSGPAANPADGPGSPAADVATDPTRAYADPHGLAGAYPAATGAGPAPGPSEAETRLAHGPARPAGLPARVAILRGCVQEALFRRVNEATVRVLEVNGHTVAGAEGQRCCGALDAHAGRLDRAMELARANIAAFEKAGVDAIVVNAAGCGAMMKEYGEQLRHDPAWTERAAAFSARVGDIAEFLDERGARQGAPLPLTVTYDAPCHLHHAQRIREAPLRLLDAIPGLRRVPLRDADECCGGAGLYGVHHPGLGGRISTDKAAAILDSGAEVVVTPNPGCIMQIGAALLLQGLETPVLHPVELMDESYRRMGEVAE